MPEQQTFTMTQLLNSMKQSQGARFETHKGGFYHDGRFATLMDVVEHYNGFLTLGLTD
jgi:hypothetical protein